MINENKSHCSIEKADTSSQLSLKNIKDRANPNEEYILKESILDLD